MKKQYYITIWTLLLIMCTACETEIDYKGEDLENFIVLNANLQADSLISCKISRSSTIFDNLGTSLIRNAEVNLYCNGELVGAGVYGVGASYYWEEKAIEGNSYTIKVNHPQYKSVNATAKIPTKADAYVSDANFDGEVEFTVTINDKPGANFYRLLVFQKNQYWDNAPDGEQVPYYDYYTTYFSSDDPVLNYNKIVNDDSSFSDIPANTYGIFNDDLFDGETYHLKLTPWSLNNIVIDVRQISKDLYLYYRSVQDSDWYGDAPMVEPIKIHSNVNGGAGILGSSNSNYTYKR